MPQNRTIKLTRKAMRDGAAISTRFAAALAEAREARGLTQRALADRCDLSHGFVGMLESGQRRPSYTVACLLARALGQKPERMLFGEG